MCRHCIADQPQMGEQSMSLHSWLQKIRSALTSRQRQRRQRSSPRAATHRPLLEVLEDRVTPSLAWPSFSESAPEGSFEWSPAPNWATADFNGDGHLDLFTAEYQYW